MLRLFSTEEVQWPPDRICGGGEGLSCFDLAKAGRIALDASAVTVESPEPYQRANRGGQKIKLVSHPLVGKIFICTACSRRCYRVYWHGGRWACRTCPPSLDYRSRHTY